MTDPNLDQNPNPTPAPAPQRDPRPTDVEYFLNVLPILVGPIVAKASDSTSGTSLAIATARELCGQLCQMGLLRAVVVLPGGAPLSIGAPTAQSQTGPHAVGAPVPAHDGRMVKQFPTVGATVVHPG